MTFDVNSKFHLRRLLLICLMALLIVSLLGLVFPQSNLSLSTSSGQSWIEDAVPVESEVTKPIQASWVAADGVLYAGSGNTLYKSLNQGQTWQTLRTFGDHLIGCVFVDSRGYVFVSPSEVSSQVDIVGLWRSTDKGQTWTRVLSLPLLCGIWGIDEDTTGALFAGVYTTGSISNARIYKSTDGGATWTSVYYDPDARHVHDIKVDEKNNYLYASVGDLLAPWNIEYITRSTDGGNTWNKILYDLPQIVAIEITSNARLFGTDESINGQMYRTTDDTTYTKVLDTGANSYCFWIRHDEFSGNTFASFVVGDVLPTNAGIYISENGGLSWAPYKTFNYYMPYAGSPLASNFVNGIMYYSVATNSGWQNGVKLYFDSSTYFEDGFESGGFGAWSGVSGGVVESGASHHGVYGARFVGVGVGGFSEASAGFVSSSLVYSRVYYRFGGGLPVNSGDRLILGMVASGDYLYGVAVEVRRIGGSLFWGLTSWEGGVEQSVFEGSASGPVVGRWYCVELKRDVVGDELELWVDGQSKVGVSRGVTQSSNLVTVGVGWKSYAGSTSVDVDCVKVAGSYIGTE